MITYKLFLLTVLLVFLSGFEVYGFEECGTVKKIENRILGGIQSKRGNWPFLAALYYTESSKFFCGSTLISAKHVLTAAHCVQQKQSTTILHPDDVLVLLGRYDLESKIERGAIQRDVDEIFVHPDWKVSSLKYDADIAIFVLSEIVTFTNFIRPVCLPNDGDNVVDSLGKVAGWGLAEDSGPRGHELIPRETTTKALNDSYCYTTIPEISRFSSTRMFCGGRESSQDGSPDKGDSGGGFFVLVDGAWVQFGIISSSLTDAAGKILPNSFPLYTNVGSFKKWILEIVKKSGSEISIKRNKSFDLKKPVDISCNYEIVLGTIYKCSVWNVNIKNDDSKVSSFTGEHIQGYSFENVSEVWFWDGNLTYIPDNIGQFFPNLVKFWVSYDTLNLGLKDLKRRNFKEMTNLWYLDVKFNDIESIDEDTLWNLPELKYFIIKNNMLKALHKQTFARNLKLKEVNASTNQLKVLHRDLFIKNTVLEKIDFRDNKLTRIGSDFTKLSSLSFLDFHGNICIDKSLNDSNSLEDLQQILNVRCAQVNLEDFARIVE